MLYLLEDIFSNSYVRDGHAGGARKNVFITFIMVLIIAALL